MTIAVGGSIGAMNDLRDQLLDTQAILTNGLKFPIAVSKWDLDQPLYDSPTGLAEPGARPVRLKSIYPLSNQGNGFVNDPRYVVTDIDGKALPSYTVDILTGDITLSGTVVGVVRFRIKEAGALVEQRGQIQSLATVINTLTSVIAMFQKQESAILNSGAIS